MVCKHHQKAKNKSLASDLLRCIRNENKIMSANVSDILFPYESFEVLYKAFVAIYLHGSRVKPNL